MDQHKGTEIKESIKHCSPAYTSIYWEYSKCRTIQDGISCKIWPYVKKLRQCKERKLRCDLISVFWVLI